jgi:EthD domain
VDRTAASATNADHPATVLVGAQAGFDYDAFTELVFQDDAAFQALFACVGQAEAAEKLPRLPPGYLGALMLNSHPALAIRGPRRLAYQF